mmetsp:Transcript_24878/g.51999  ORF Transcript_24878/g.51999 Transcript_24878/m.51999 type:complete len:238 (-) Transcript_24878:368-1081(-)
MKLSLNDGRPLFKNLITVKGTVLNQFSLDEYNSHLRVATTSGFTWTGTSKNNLYVFDADGNMTGALEGLAQGERIYSVRYNGPMGYVVTFRQVDPLFAIDLSDPTSPRVLGELKVDGVSNYLHMVNDTHIIGLGAAAGANGGLGGGLQLSLFDVTDVKRPVLAASKVFGTSSSSSLATTDHKAFLYHPGSGIIAVPVTTWDYSAGGSFWDGAMVFSLSGQGFQHRLSLSHARPGGNT